MLGPVQDVGLGRFGVVGGNELFLHHVLNLLHGGDLFFLFQLCHNSLGQLVQLLVAHLLGGVAHVGLKDGAAYLGSVEGGPFPPLRLMMVFSMACSSFPSSIPSQPAGEERFLL